MVLNVNPPNDPPRLKKLRLEIIKEIPRFPNNRRSLCELEKKSLDCLLINYFNWRSRYVGSRPRAIHVDTSAFFVANWLQHTSAIGKFLDKVRRGENLCPHLSSKPNTKGYSSVSGKKNASPHEKWGDKDHLLNSMGYHHFHLGMDAKPNGSVSRTGLLIMAKVGLIDFDVIGVFDHNVFDANSFERARLLAKHDEITSFNVPAGSVFVGAAITTSGHATHVVSHAANCAKDMRRADSRLNDRGYLDTLYAHAGLQTPSNPKFQWRIDHLDLQLLDWSTAITFTLRRGWN